MTQEGLLAAARGSVRGGGGGSCRLLVGHRCLVDTAQHIMWHVAWRGWTCEFPGDSLPLYP